MKGFSDDLPGQEKTASSINVSALLKTIMSSESHDSHDSHASFWRVNLEGRNVGASMIVRRNSTSVGEVNEGCGFNIYITNNVQGVHNSQLVGSQLNMGDSGLWVTLKNGKLGQGFSGRRIDLAVGLGIMLGFAAVVVYLVIRFI